VRATVAASASPLLGEEGRVARQHLFTHLGVLAEKLRTRAGESSSRVGMGDHSSVRTSPSLLVIGITIAEKRLRSNEYRKGSYVPKWL